MRIKAFTLIEILVVIVIIGIGCHFAALAFGDFGAARAAKVAVQDLDKVLRLLRYKSVVDSQTYGIEISNTEYITKYLKQGNWQRLKTRDKIYHKNFPKYLTAKLLKPKDYIIVVDQTGAIADFSLEFYLRNKQFAHIHVNNKQQIITDFTKANNNA